ncbi:MAG: class I SAM-dependent methyltransferase [Opitutaceae bacterium]
MANKQKFTLFHTVDDGFLRDWHLPYAQVFKQCKKVVDLGCGPGVFLDLLRENGIYGIGLDIDSTVVSQAKERGHEAAVATDKEIAKFSPGADGIHISHVIEYLWGDDLLSLLKTCASSLNPGGALIVRTPNWGNPNVSGGGFWDDYTHKRPYSLIQLTRLFEDLGLVITAQGFEPFGWGDTYVIGRKPRLDGQEIPADQLIWSPRFLQKPYIRRRDRPRLWLKRWLLGE